MVPSVQFQIPTSKNSESVTDVLASVETFTLEQIPNFTVVHRFSFTVVMAEPNSFFPEMPLLTRLADANTLTVLISRPFYLLAFDSCNPTGQEVRSFPDHHLRLARRLDRAASALQSIFTALAELKTQSRQIKDGPARAQAEALVTRIIDAALQRLSDLGRDAGAPFPRLTLEDLLAWTNALAASLSNASAVEWNLLPSHLWDKNTPGSAAPPSSPDAWQRWFDRLGNQAAKEIRGLVVRLAEAQVYEKHRQHDQTARDDMIDAAAARTLASIARYGPQKGLFATWAYTVIHRAIMDFFRARYPDSSGKVQFPDKYQKETEPTGLSPHELAGYLSATSVPPPSWLPTHDPALPSADPPYNLERKDFTAEELRRLYIMRHLAEDDTEVIRDGGDIKFLERYWKDAPRGGSPKDDQGNKIPSVYQRIAQVHPSIKNVNTLKQRAWRYWKEYRSALEKFLF